MIFDAVVLAAVLISSVIAILRGFIRELLTIVGVGGGLAAAWFGGPFFSPAMHGWLGVEEAKEGEEAQKLFDMVPMTIVADVCAYGLIFIVVVIVLSVLSHFLAAGAKAVGLGPVDRFLGFLFGVARAGLLLALLYLPVFLLVESKDRDEWFEGSMTRPYVERASEMIAAFLPEDKKEEIDNKTKQANDKMNETRDRLQGMDVLKDTADKAADAIEGLQERAADAPSETPATQGDGYEDKQRQSMDQLIEETQTPPSNP